MGHVSKPSGSILTVHLNQSVWEYGKLRMSGCLPSEHKGSFSAQQAVRYDVAVMTLPVIDRRPSFTLPYFRRNITELPPRMTRLTASKQKRGPNGPFFIYRMRVLEENLLVRA
jgi:hypothetical protein